MAKKLVRHPGFHSIDGTVKDGFPVTYWYTISRADPEAGMMSEGIDEEFITDRMGHAIPFITPSEADFVKLREAAVQSLEHRHD